MKKHSFFLFCCLMLFYQLYAEYKTNVHSIARREGLSNGAVNTIAKDAEGYVWFGTWNGLNRYDGSNIVSYMPGSNPFTLHNQVVREIFPTSKGPLWMLTNKGLAYYDNLYNRFYSFFTDESEQINYENDISLCHSDEFGTWTSVYGKGVFNYDSITGQFIKRKFEKGSVQASMDVKNLYLIESKLYCITGGNVLYEINGNHLQEIMKLPIDAAISSSIGVLFGNRPWLFLAQRDGKAIMVDIDKQVVSRLRIPDDIITSFAPSSDSGKLWAGTEKGKIYAFNFKSKTFEILRDLSELFVNNPISARVISICETAPDILWVGTDGNGVYNLKLSEFPNKSLGSEQLSYPIVRCILVTRKKDILIGTKGGGIDVFDSKGNHIKEISVKNGLSNNSVLSIHELKDGTIWAGTDGSGVDIISPDFNTIKNYPRDFNSQSSFNFASVYHIHQDNDQRLYLGTSGFGVIMIELDKNKHPNPVYSEQIILDKNLVTAGQQKQIVYAITQERPGIIWIGTRGFGVYRYNTITKRVLAQFNTSTNPELIKNDDILALYTDSATNIWVGCSSGIFSFIPELNGPVKIMQLNLNEDLSNTSIHAFQMDGQGNLWASTTQGLSCIDPKLQTVKNFNSDDGLINNEYSDGASFFDHSTGQLYIGGTMGVDIIQTSEIKFASYFPPIAINDLYIKNQAVEISASSVLHTRMNLQSKLLLEYDQNALTFFVTPLAYWGKERHKISYRLINFDDNWVTNLHNQAIIFTNLEPGKYILQLRLSDESGNWSDQIKEVEIIIKPPPWQTSWAIAAYILFFIGIQLLIIRWYIRRESRKKEIALLEFKQLKEKELHNYKIEFFTNVAHEFRTPLTLISSHIHALIEETRTSGISPRLLKVYNNSIKLQKLVLEIMQFRKLEKGKASLNISNVNLETLALDVVSDLELLAQNHQITCEVYCKNENISINTDADKYQRILTNLISNAIKYNKQGGFVKVKISCGENEHITEVEDNGVGINPELKNNVFEPFGISSAHQKGSFPGYRSTGLGLAVTKGIVELLGGSINFESKLNEGTRFICRFPDIHQVNTSQTIDQLSGNRDEMSFIDETKQEAIHDTVNADAEKATILLVDDDREILILLSNMLGSSYNICFAENGSKAWQKIKTEKFDLVVSDIMMPEMDGIELCRKIRENFDTSHLPLILLTAKAEIEDRIKGLLAGADSYIPKPFHPDHLRIRIARLLETRKNIRKYFGLKDGSTVQIKKIPDPFFQKMLNYIDDNIDDETLSAENLIDKFAISKSSLYNKTKTVLGITPHGLINQRRIQKAAVLLDTSLLTVSEIIDQTGFTSRTYFYKHFNKSFSCSPTEYRLKRKSKE